MQALQLGLGTMTEIVASPYYDPTFIYYLGQNPKTGCLEQKKMHTAAAANKWQGASEIHPAPNLHHDGLFSITEAITVTTRQIQFKNPVLELNTQVTGNSNIVRVSRLVRNDADVCSCLGRYNC